ncbi:hypothetical protein VP01_1129g5 [Puccinia sorghi]|uniref:MHD domain-containing protein n=1 Tax=Puccinia sorghi TaxID=27349 RepID=A0A0L6VS59_9BASI|nr:hypothetical protein VP01_1129g5 [Puccinia sorghi]
MCKQRNQEIWLDLLEFISAILDPDGRVIKFQVVGMVDIQSKLSGLPDITLKFIHPTKIGKLGFHSCVRYSKWEKEKLVSFIPPDGPFRLMSYQSTLNTSSSSLPVTIKPKITIGEQGGSFKLFITSLASISHLIIRWQLGKLATGIIPEHLQCRARDGRLLTPAWEWDESNKEIRWSFKGEDVNCCLTGLWRHGSKENTPSRSIRVEFESRVGSPNLSFLGLKVEKIDINQHSTATSHYSADRKNTLAAALTAPFISPAVAKGVRMKFKSSQYEIRW